MRSDADTTGLAPVQLGHRNHPEGSGAGATATPQPAAPHSGIDADRCPTPGCARRALCTRGPCCLDCAHGFQHGAAPCHSHGCDAEHQEPQATGEGRTAPNIEEEELHNESNAPNVPPAPGPPVAAAVSSEAPGDRAPPVAAGAPGTPGGPSAPPGAPPPPPPRRLPAPAPTAPSEQPPALKPGRPTRSARWRV